MSYMAEENALSNLDIIGVAWTQPSTEACDFFFFFFFFGGGSIDSQCYWQPSLDIHIEKGNAII